MKKICVALLLLLTVGLSTALATDEIGISRRVKESFKKEFAGVDLVRWSNLGDYQVAIFVFDSHMVEAYFNSETAELEGYARYLIFDELPLAVMKSFDKNFARTDFISALEISNAEGNCYRLIIETQGKRFSVKISAGGNVLEKLRLQNKKV